MEKRIKEALEEIGVWLKMHSGGVDFVSFEEDSGTLFVKLNGACKGCPLSEITLKEGIESFLKEKIPEINQVKKIDW